MDLLAIYELATGQKVNKSKSCFFTSKRCTVAQVRFLSSLTGMHQGSLPFKYLGFVLFKGKRKASYFQHILDRITSKLAGWVGKLLSPGGRLMLIKHVLAAIPLHTLAVLEPPKGVLQKIEKLFADLLWGRDQDQQKRHWSRWSRLSFPYAEGGLGVRNVADILASFSCKLWWKCRSNTDGPIMLIGFQLIVHFNDSGC